MWFKKNIEKSTVMYWSQLHTMYGLGFPGGASGKEPTCQFRRYKRFYPWVGKIPWRRAWQPTPSRILAWRIPWTEEPGDLWSIGLQRDLYHESWEVTVLLGFLQRQSSHPCFACPGRTTRERCLPQHPYIDTMLQDSPISLDRVSPHLWLTSHL